MKNAPTYRLRSRTLPDYPASSPSRRRGNSRSLFVATPSGHLTSSKA
jgi:hypothetical protein